MVTSTPRKYRNKRDVQITTKKVSVENFEEDPRVPEGGVSGPGIFMLTARSEQGYPPQTPTHNQEDRYLITPRNVPVVKRQREVEVVYGLQRSTGSESLLNNKKIRNRRQGSRIQ